jgi:hypothetical protein
MYIDFVLELFLPAISVGVQHVFELGHGAETTSSLFLEYQRTTRYQTSTAILR